MTPDGIKRLILDEGTGPMSNGRLLPYWDDTSKAANRNNGNGGWLTVGFGRNIGANGIRCSEAMLMLTNDLNDMSKAVAIIVGPAFTTMPAVWADTLLMIHYNTGNVGAWPLLIAGMRNGNTNQALAQIQNSVAYKGVQHARYDRFCTAVLYRRWLFTDAENAEYSKLGLPAVS